MDKYDQVLETPDAEDLPIEMKPKKQRQQKPARKLQAQRSEVVGADEVMAMNRVKTRNKLVGDLANHGIYDSDDGVDE